MAGQARVEAPSCPPPARRRRSLSDPCVEPCGRCWCPRWWRRNRGNETKSRRRQRQRGCGGRGGCGGQRHHRTAPGQGCEGGGWWGGNRGNRGWCGGSITHGSLLDPEWYLVAQARDWPIHYTDWPITSLFVHLVVSSGTHLEYHGRVVRHCTTTAYSVLVRPCAVC